MAVGEAKGSQGIREQVYEIAISRAPLIFSLGIQFSELYRLGVLIVLLNIAT